MRTNRSIRRGIAFIAGAFLLLLLYVVFSARRAAQTTVAQNNVPPEGVTQVSVNTGRRTAIALETIPERSIITANMFRVEDLPEDAPPGDYVTIPESQAIGFITRRRITANQRIRLSDLVGHITDVGIAGALRPGTRAMTVTLANKPTFHDIVRIGDTVDIIAAFDSAESRTLVENVRVLAVDVFGKDYPQASVALRGDYKAPSRSIRADNPPSPGGNNTGAATNSASTPAATNANGQPVVGQPGPTPTPTPAPTPPPPRPAPALTVEVTPDQTNRISLAQNSGGVLDFILVPHEAPVFVPGVTRVVSVTRPQIAPFAEARKRAGASNSKPLRSASTGGSSSSGNSRGSTRGSRTPAPDFSTPALPQPAEINSGTPPMDVTSSAPSTYTIPIYVDGKKVRIDTVRKPAE